MSVKKVGLVLLVLAVLLAGSSAMADVITKSAAVDGYASKAIGGTWQGLSIDPASSMYVGTDLSGVTYIERKTLVKFSIADMVGMTTVNSATLSMGYSFTVGSSPKPIDVFSIASTSGATLDNSDFDIAAIGGSLGVILGTGYPSAGNMTLDVTSAVQTALDNGEDYIAFRLEVVDPYQDTRSMRAFVSRSNTAYPDRVPSLEINAIPEPASMSLIALGGFFLAGRRRRV